MDFSILATAVSFFLFSFCLVLYPLTVKDVMLYTEKRERGDDLYYIYFWQGRHSSTVCQTYTFASACLLMLFIKDEKGASALLAKELDDSLNGKGTQIRVVQNKEPDHFLGLFNGTLIIKNVWKIV